ncbi:hypothetical protein KNHN1_20360 [Pseudomonas guariconensis]
MGEEIEVAAKHDELSADAANGFTVISAKVGRLRSQKPSPRAIMRGGTMAGRNGRE